MSPAFSLQENDANCELNIYYEVSRNNSSLKTVQDNSTCLFERVGLWKVWKVWKGCNKEGA